MRTKLAITLSVLMLSLAAASAQESAPAVNRGWYVGAEGGVPFSFGSFTSFGHDKTHAGYGAGLYGGYRFNPVLSAEISAKWGRTTLSAHGCCVDAGYWLGADGITEIRHDDNFIWESGARIGWNFGKSGRKKASASSSVSAVAPVIPGMCVTLVGRCDALAYRRHAGRNLDRIQSEPCRW